MAPVPTLVDKGVVPNVEEAAPKVMYPLELMKQVVTFVPPNGNEGIVILELTLESQVEYKSVAPPATEIGV
jgi:hypothetical protein